MRRDPIARYIEADISCYHCGDTVGLLRRAYGVAGAPTWYLGPARGIPAVVKRLTDLRCARCRGPVYPSTLELRRDDRPVGLRRVRQGHGCPSTRAG
jgi:hypothetical protein